jgi:hypothetical protein
MGSLADTISSLLARLAELLGLKSTEDKRMHAMQAKLASARADNTDRLEGLKEQIRTLEAAALRKKKEMESAKGDTKRIVVGEIERIFRDLDRLRGSENIITANLEKIAVAQAKLKELTEARAQSVSQDQLDDLALDLQQAFSELRLTDRAAKDLERVEYAAPQRTPVAVDERLAQTEGVKEQPAAELSEETKRRLAALETE